jgi:hypothetical protein
VLPLVASAGLDRVHVFGVLYRPALGGLLWLCDELGLALSTDSSGPVLQCTFPDHKKAGRLAPTWEGNVEAHRQRVLTLRDSEFYPRTAAPPRAAAEHPVRRSAMTETWVAELVATVEKYRAAWRAANVQRVFWASSDVEALEAYEASLDRFVREWHEAQAKGSDGHA